MVSLSEGDFARALQAFNASALRKTIAIIHV